MFRAVRIIALAVMIAASSSCANQYVVDGHKLAPRTVLPGYPGEARFHRWEGSCVVTLFVNADGSVRDAKVVKSTGHSILDQEALQTMRTWRFVPEKVPFVAKVPCHFKYVGR